MLLLLLLFILLIWAFFILSGVFLKEQTNNKKVGTKHYTYEGKFSVFWHKNTVKIQQKNKLNFHKCNGSNAFHVWYHISSINWQIK